MSFLSRLFGSATPPQRAGEIVGNSDFDYEIVGESFYQQALSLICGGKTETGHNLFTTATLILESDNPYDRNAVAVYIAGYKVGHLNRREAAAFRSILADVGLHQASVDAVVVGGWRRRGGADEGHFGVKLDVGLPLQFRRI